VSGALAPAPFREEPLGLRLTAGRAEFLFTNANAGDFAAAAEADFESVELASGIARADWAQAEQVHGTNVNLIDGNQQPGSYSTPADGQATSRGGVLCAVRTADCLPVLLGDDNAIGALHAGWRGLVAGVLDSGVAALHQLGADQLVAAIGPGARGCCYEVSGEMCETFAEYPAALANPGNLDLAAVARAQLEAAGVGTIYDCGICTICSSPDDFFSYRRDRGDTGRMLGATWLS